MISEVFEALGPNAGLRAGEFIVLLVVFIFTLPYVIPSQEDKEDDEYFSKHWEELQDCAHRALIIPPDSVQSFPKSKVTVSGITRQAIKRAKKIVTPQDKGKRAGRRQSGNAGRGRNKSGGSSGEWPSVAEINGKSVDGSDPRAKSPRVVDENGNVHFINSIPDDCVPLLCFVNSRSGATMGKTLIHQLRRLLNPIQVVDLAHKGPNPALEQFGKLPRLRLLVCGGDGTVGWVLNALDEVKLEKRPAIAILPLGTGNDLARVLGWGGGYQNDSLLEFLKEVYHAHVTLLDRWTCHVDPNGRKEGRDIKFNNYWGLGVDAQAALRFHHMRESKPGLFFSTLVNKFWYTVMGTQELFKRSCHDLIENVKLEVDGQEVELPEGCEGLVFMNIGSYGGGVQMWTTDASGEPTPRTPGGRLGGLFDDLLHPLSDDASDADSDNGSVRTVEEDLESKVSSMQDGKLDVVAIKGVFHLGQLQIGLSKAVKVCQCSNAVVRTTKAFPMQADGEPWGEKACAITIQPIKEKAYMLTRTTASGGVVAKEMVRLLDWAEEKSVISAEQKLTLQGEFSRRIEKYNTAVAPAPPVDAGGRQHKNKLLQAFTG